MKLKTGNLLQQWFMLIDVVLFHSSEIQSYQNRKGLYTINVYEIVR